MAETLTPESIKQLVTDHEAATSNMRNRMETDYNWYRLSWTDSRQIAKSEGYETYISSEPRAYAKRMIAWLAGAAMIVRVPLEEKQTEERKVATANEQFITGALDEADKLLLARIMPRLRDQWAFQICIRGWYAGRVLLIKLPDGKTQVDISPFDPLHTFWGRGPEGLAWVVHRSVRTSAELIAEYPEAEELVGSDHKDTGIEVYDYYDGERNAVCVGQGWLKKPQEHYSPRFPVILGPVGATPPIVAQLSTTEQDIWEHYGESIYDDSRKIHEQWNRSMSDRMTLARRAVKTPLVYESRDGRKFLGGDPFESGAEVDIAQGERLQPLLPPPVTPTTDPFLAMVSGESQRATIPHSIYGELQFQLSGYAINTLRQGVDAAIQPRLQAMQNAYEQVAGLLLAQYGTGGFAPLLVRGRLANRQYFVRTITPQEINPQLVPEITLTPKLPEDDMQKYAMAQMAREGKPLPLLPDRMIRDSILKIQDVDGVEAIIREEQAERASPIAVLAGFIENAEKRGRYDQVAIYMDELNNFLQQRAMQQAALAGGPAGPEPLGQVPAKKPLMLRPEMGGPPMMGVSPPVPIPQGGPLVAPGSPRPGARAPLS